MPLKDKTLPVLSRFSLLLNGTSGIFAFAFFIVGLLFSYKSLSTLDIEAILYLNDEVEIGEGEILDVFETNYTVNDVSIYGYDYVFFSPLGEYYWTSYLRGYRHDVGDKVKVEYHPERPDINRIQGMSNTFGGIVFMIPLIISIGWIIYNLLVGWKRIRIIRNGVLAEGTLVYKESTFAHVNDRQVYKLIFSFPIGSDRYEITTRTHKPEKLEGGKTRTVIYNRNNPSQGLILDNLPWTVGKEIKKRWQN